MRRAEIGASAVHDRLDFLEGLRGIFALYVVLGHICSMADPSGLAGKVSQAPSWLRAVMAPFSYGHLAVAGFIVISGFCLQMSIFRRAKGRLDRFSGFYRRRARRILPPYYGALALSILVSLTVTAQLANKMPFAMYLPVTWENVLAHVFLVHNFSLAWMYKINGVLWSIAIEAQLYVVFPVLIRAFERIGRWPILLASGLLAAVVLRFVPDAMKLYPWFAPLFVLGMVSAWAAYRPNITVGVHPRAGWVLAGLFTVISGVACAYSTDLVASDIPFGAAVAALAYAGAVTDGGGLAIGLSWRPLVVLGGFSYSLYLVHHPVQQVLYSFRPAGVVDEVGLAGYLFLTLPLVLLFSWAFAVVFEKPWRKTQATPTLDEPITLMPTTLPLRTYRK